MTTPSQPAIRPRAVVSWILYDLANTIFTMGVISMIFPLWIRDQVGVDRADRIQGLVTSVSMALIFVLSPIIGAMTDRARRRMPFLVVSTVGCVGLTLLLGRFGWWPTIIGFVVANALYQAGLQFYDSLLPSVSTEENRGRVGGWGVGIGYFGSFLAIFLSSVAAARGWPRSHTFSALAAGFLLFAWPSFFFVRERENENPGNVWSFRATMGALRETIRALIHSDQFPGLARFLLGRMFYTDAINTVVGIMTLFAMNVAVRGGVPKDDAEGVSRIVMLVAVLFAIVGGLVWGRLVDRFGPRRVLKWVLVLWMMALSLAAAMGLFALPMVLLYVVGILAGLCLGGTWAADRPLMLDLTPPERLGEFYGLYGMVGRFAAIVGPLVWGGITAWLVTSGWSALSAQGVALIALFGMVAVAYGVLLPVLKGGRRGATG